MNKHNQNKPSLGQIYRESTAHAVHLSGVDFHADALVDAASGRLTGENRETVIAALAGSSVEADLYRLLQALEPASNALAKELTAHVSDDVVVPFKRAQSPQRAAIQRRHTPLAHWGWLAVAASVVAAVFLAMPRDLVREAARTAGVVQPHLAVPPGDEIFRAEMSTSVASNGNNSSTGARRDDTIFNSNAADRADTIFSGRFTGG